MRFVSFVILIALFSAGVYGENQSTKDLAHITKAFLDAKNARQQPDSDEADIDAFIAFFADEFVDEHVKFNVTVTSKADLKSAMLEKLKDNIIFSHLKVDDMMVGRDVVFVQYTEHAKGQPAHLDKPIEYTATNLMAIEYDSNGKIKHLRRHHGVANQD